MFFFLFLFIQKFHLQCYPVNLFFNAMHVPSEEPIGTGQFVWLSLGMPLVHNWPQGALWTTLNYGVIHLWEGLWGSKNKTPRKLRRHRSCQIHTTNIYKYMSNTWTEGIMIPVITKLVKIETKTEIHVLLRVPVRKLDSSTWCTSKNNDLFSFSWFFVFLLFSLWII